MVGSEYRRVVDEVAELKTKLREAQRAAEEAMERRKEEEERTHKLQKQLQDIRSKPGGSNMEVELMRQIVELQGQVGESGKGMLAEMDKVRDLQKNVRDKSDEALGMHRKAQAVEKQRQELQAQVSEALLKTKGLEEELASAVFRKEELESGMELVQRERDETIELLQKAVEQNRDLKARRLNTKQQLEENKKFIAHATDRDVESMRSLLFNLENMISKQAPQQGLGPVEREKNAELRKDLISLRDAVRQLLTHKTGDEDK